MSKSQIFLCFCLSFIFGVALSSFFNFSLIALLIFFILGIFLISVFWKRKEIVVLGFCLIFMTSGAYRYQVTISRLERPGLEGWADQKVSLVGIIIEEPKIGFNKSKLKVESEGLATKILVTTASFPQYKYADRLKIVGTLKEPPVFEGFNYKDYLQKQGVYFLMTYPEIEILERGYGDPLREILISFKTRLKDSLRKSLSSPQLGLFEALLFGEEENISQEWKEKLNITGTRHIAAVSGANITIICNLLLSFLLALGFWRKHAFWLSLILIFLYVLMIGAPSSGVRAAIMGTLLLIAQYVGRLSQPERLLTFALAVMLAFNPLLLRYDIGFQLSFLAVVGLIYLQSFFSKILVKVPNFLDLRLNLSTTLAAQLFVLPILLYNFGQISLVSPITNILILPAIPYLTMAGFLFSFLGIFSQILGMVFSWPAQIVLIFLMKVIDFFSQFPLASKNFKISWLFLLISYFILAVFVWRIKEREKLKFLNY